MRQQVLVIHGGDAYETYGEYLDGLKSKELKIEMLQFVGWKDNLAKDLGKDFDVLLPKMPNAQNAKYNEWKIWFEKITPLLSDNIILIGHSLGGIFLAKYLAENKFPKKIKALFILAAPYHSMNEPLADFNIESGLGNVSKQAEKIFLYHSKDDLVVPFESLENYQKEFPNAEIRIFEDKGHFHVLGLPELIEDIKSL